ncbi:DNA-binding protein [Azospirillaceae bacterium]
MSIKISQEKLERLLLIEDVHELTSIPISTLKLYTATGKIPSIKIGRHRRYDPAEIRKWLKRMAS